MATEGGDGESQQHLKTWVSDGLMALLGCSQGIVVQLVLRLARECASAGDLAARLVDLAGFPSSPDTSAFAADVHARLPPRHRLAVSGATSEYQRQAQDAAALARKQTQFKLLVDDGDETAALPDGGRNVRRRRCPESDEDAGDHEDEEDDEEEMRRDQAARAELERNIRERDEASTRKLMDRKPSKREQDETARRAEAMDRGGGDTSELRRLSHEEYLKMRAKKKVEELRDELADEERMFAGVRRTDAEEREFKRKKELYNLVHGHADRYEGAAGDYYRMPDAYDDAMNVDQGKRFSVVTRRHDDDARGSKGKKAFSEQESWEEQQIRKSQLQFGAQDRTHASDEYQFVFEDAVEFVKSAAMAGTDLDDGETDELADEIKVTLQRELQDQRKALPVYKFKDELLKAIAEHQIIIVVGETGSGKTTQIPQYLHEAGYTSNGRRIACTQPRRVAAMSVAARVAEEMGVKLGHEVGYAIRFEDCTSDRTVAKYMTDGMLLREFLGEPDLSSYGVVVVDEAHERSISTDILLGLVKDVARFRPDLKLLISSATLNAERFSDFFDMAPVFKIPGRRYTVDIHYTVAPEADYVDAAVATVLQLHVTQPSPGDILVFLTGQEEIETVEEILRRRTRGLGTKIAELVICPIYANLPTELQAKIFEPAPPGARKVVLATNIAETSLTIDGISYVVDPGFCKVKSYSPRTGTESLLVQPISKASADQRAGRSGRTGPGKCFRLFTEHSYAKEMEDETVPEIQRSNLASVVLSLKALGINDLVSFDFMDPPASEGLLRALEDLFALGALNSRGELTKTGRRMAELPLDPMLAKAIVASEKYGCSEEMITIASMLSAGNAVFYRPKDKALIADAARQRFFNAGGGGDHVALLNVYTEWEQSGHSAQWCVDHFVQSRTMRRARDVREQLVALLERVEIERRSSAGDLDAVRKAITAGFFRNAAQRRRDGSYRTVKSWRTVFVHPSSGMARVDPPPRWVLYHELVETTREYMRQVTELKPGWLLEIAPHYYQENNLDTPEPKKAKSHGQDAAAAVATEKPSLSLKDFFKA
ncbi:hypothetical protein HU200_008260 [Digitaria exilis]|uniref:RNA helicase n=1 Tax=Digitaria exilis TaxID=1010633 RepID=A0A835FNU6_9POAL|nr:hypothetical protein HU200_008260 [Digitaria exilis]CAB3465363.1 unnamed protein product [Digitaria exilis]